ncbi:hypothetical protein BJX99DRAFT_256905 [Aspergillus californicus]
MLYSLLAVVLYLPSSALGQTLGTTCLTTTYFSTVTTGFPTIESYLTIFDCSVTGEPSEPPEPCTSSDEATGGTITCPGSGGTVWGINPTDTLIRIPPRGYQYVSLPPSEDTTPTPTPSTNPDSDSDDSNTSELSTNSDSPVETGSFDLPSNKSDDTNSSSASTPSTMTTSSISSSSESFISSDPDFTSGFNIRGYNRYTRPVYLPLQEYLSSS